MKFEYMLFGHDLYSNEAVTDWIELKGDFTDRAAAQARVQYITTLPYQLRESY